MSENRNLIERVLESPYSRENFKILIANILKKPIQDQNFRIHLSTMQSKYFEEAFLIDNVELKDRNNNSKKVAIIEVKLKRTTGLVKPRYYQRDFIAKYLKDNHLMDAALVSFYLDREPDWRFSLVQMYYSYEEGKQKTEKSPAVRYTYLVGENEPSHTAKKQLLSLLESSEILLDDIFGAFSIEKVGIEFFREYEALYKKLLENLENNPVFKYQAKNYRLEPSNFAKKLLGRIVFLYFIQKKGWLGVPKNKNWGEGDKNFLYNLFLESTGKTSEKHYLINYPETTGNYYNDVLEHLFYDALNKQNLNTVSRDFHPYFNSKIPFLNGGLFESEYDWENTELYIDNDIFEEIFEVFNRYNFTVKEEDPLDKDVAVDPEMLGKIFENLLAQEERKSTGSFYTPRPIVYYMVKESLFYYLKEHLENIPDEDLRILLEGNIDGWNTLPPDSIFDNAEKIDKLLEKIKVVDPAVGSGAFIVSILQEIVHLRILLSEYFDCDKSERTEYKLKKFAIENSIYGVDIDPGAVDIAKLRLWLSLVVEHEIDEIEPLPNLDYKIMSGNSLIEELIVGDRAIPLNPPKANTTFISELNNILKTYEQKKSEYFKTYDEEKKRNLAKELEELRKRYIKKSISENLDRFKTEMDGLRTKYLMKGLSIPQNEAKKLVSLAEKVNEFENILKDIDNLKSATFFPWKFQFSEVFKEGGFDIVIGNPPYIQLQKTFQENKHYADLYKHIGFNTFERTGDIYVLFYEKGINLLKDKGILTFITSNKWMRANYGKSLRKFLSEYKPLILIDLGPNVFESATVDTNILIVKKEKPKTNNLKALTLNSKDKIYSLKDDDFTILNNLSEDSWIILTPEEQRIKEKIEKIGTPLKDWDININYGIKTGYNEAFIIDGETKDKLIAKDPKSAEIIKPILRGRDIKRYRAEFADKWLINTHNGYINSKGERIPPVDINDYPAIKEHLDKYWTKLKARQDKGITPYNLRNCAYLEEFEKEKIVYGQFRKGTFHYTDYWHYVGSNEYIITLSNNENDSSLKYLIAVLNSKISYQWLTLSTNNLGGNTTISQKSIFRNLPIPKISKKDQKPFEDLVDKIIAKKERGEDTSKEEFQIDLMVYKLYNLTYDEIKIIDPEIESKITREEWERGENWSI